jgi:hypothetical protein
VRHAHHNRVDAVRRYCVDHRLHGRH